MSYFPFYYDIEGRKALVVGGGHIAKGKVEKLLPYGPDLKVVSPTICNEIRELAVKYDNLTYEERPFDWKDADGCFMVISATNNNKLNHDISVYCKERNIPVNVVDRVKDCSFIFPALVKKGMLSIGISTEGASPRASVYFKDKINEIIPDNIESVLEFLYSIRPVVRDRISPETERANFYHIVFDRVMSTGEAIPEDELHRMVDDFANKLHMESGSVDFNW